TQIFNSISSVLGQCDFITCQLYEYHFIKEQMSWDEARAYCRENYTDLAKVFDLKDMRRLQDSAQNQTEAWIGLYNITGGANRRWHWSLPGEEYTENKSCWEDGEPNDYGGIPENCVMTKDKCVDVPCTNTNQFICYNETMKNNKTFHLNDKENKTWEEALNYCREKHHDLVSISNPEEQRWVQERAKNASTPFVWLGLRYSCTLDLWFWINDNRVCYERWASGGRNEDCDMSAAMTTGGQHEWVSQKKNETFNFICIKH
uniref:C-type lectin domain-containing protein n=1 Tax=Oreochromis aureus TaxID=47969 RepID=A0A668VH02_OREAU